MHRVVEVQPLEGYRIRLRFADGMQGIVDLSDLVGKGVFHKWEDPNEFARAFVDPETHTVAWPGGIDLCPDSLYREVAEQAKAA